MENFTDEAKRLLTVSKQEAHAQGQKTITPDHLWLALFTSDEMFVQDMLQKLNVDVRVSQLYDQLKTALCMAPVAPTDTTSVFDLSPRSKVVIRRAALLCNKSPLGRRIHSEHLLIALLYEQCQGSLLLAKWGVTVQRLEGYLKTLPGPTSTFDFAALQLDQIKEPASTQAQEKLQETHSQQVQETQETQGHVQQSQKTTETQTKIYKKFMLVVACLWLLEIAGLCFLFGYALFTGVVSQGIETLFHIAPFLWIQPRVGWYPLLSLLLGVLSFSLSFVLMLQVYWATKVLLPRLQGKTRETQAYVWRTWFYVHWRTQLIALVCFLLLLEVVYTFFIFFPSNWWLWSTLFYGLFALISSFYRVKIIFSWVYTIIPITDGPVRACLDKQLAQTRLHVDGLYIVENKRKQHKAAPLRMNAFALQWGRKKRVMLTESMIAGCSLDEIEVILAHELAHIAARDGLSRLGVRTICYGLFFLSCQLFIQHVVGNLTGIGTFLVTDAFNMLLLAYIFLLGLSMLYLSFSRWGEHRADDYSLQLTRNVEAFKRVMIKLNGHQVAYQNSSIFVKLLSTHPSLADRLKHASRFAARTLPRPTTREI